MNCIHRQKITQNGNFNKQKITLEHITVHTRFVVLMYSVLQCTTVHVQQVSVRFVLFDMSSTTDERALPLDERRVV